MLKNRSLRLAALLSASLGLAPSALAAETPQSNRPYVFETVDSYIATGTSRFEITGILQGESTPRTLSFRIAGFNEAAVYISRCDRMALLAMSKPGAWFLELVQLDDSFTVPTCRLTRR
ncbi:hypothetical protein ACLESD_43525 [Pyxidicoccus sp. 3LFB2]